MFINLVGCLERDTSNVPELEIMVTENLIIPRAKEFQKHVMIVYNNLEHAEDMGVTVDGQYVPNQHILGDKQCVLHTFYRRDPTGVTIFTKHFSLFKLYCVKHADNSAYNGNLLTGLFMKQSHAEKKTFVDLKVVVDVQRYPKTVRFNII